MRQLKWALAVALGLTPAVALGAGQSSSKPTSFVCSDGKGFEVEYRDGGRTAAVKTATEDFLLPHKVSSLGDRYASERATLIIDGDFAAFVSQANSDYSGCRAAADQPVKVSAKSKAPRSN